MKSKWFYKPQKEINKEIKERYKNNARMVEQVISKDDVFEKYIINTEEEMFVLMYQMKKVDYGGGFRIFRFKTF